jgi:hypothetical protein
MHLSFSEFSEFGRGVALVSQNPSLSGEEFLTYLGHSVVYILMIELVE